MVKFYVEIQELCIAYLTAMPFVTTAMSVVPSPTNIEMDDTFSLDLSWKFVTVDQVA